MNRSRRGVAGLTAAVVTGSAVVLGMVHLVLGVAVDKQEMSLGGADPTAMSLGAWFAGGLLAVLLLLCGALLVRVAATDRPPVGLVRALLVGVAVLHAVLATVAVGLVGWLAFGVLILVFVLIMLTLTLYPQAPPGERSPAGPRPAGPAGSTGSAGSVGPQIGDDETQLGQQPA